jgi:hypothetical protein
MLRRSLHRVSSPPPASRIAAADQRRLSSPIARYQPTVRNAPLKPSFCPRSSTSPARPLRAAVHAQFEFSPACTLSTTGSTARCHTSAAGSPHEVGSATTPLAPPLCREPALAHWLASPTLSFHWRSSAGLGSGGELYLLVSAGQCASFCSEFAALLWLGEITGRRLGPTSLVIDVRDNSDRVGSVWHVAGRFWQFGMEFSRIEWDGTGADVLNRNTAALVHVNS